MTDAQFSASLRAFSRRRPFRHFVIEFFNNKQIQVKHSEGIAPSAGVWIFVQPKGGRVVFSSTSVCRLLDLPEVVAG
jgi:hypothetical protein